MNRIGGRIPVACRGGFLKDTVKKGGIMKLDRWMMGGTALWVVVLLLALTSCASQPVAGQAADDLAGANMAHEFAKQDGIEFDCFKYWRVGGQPSLEVRQDYRTRLREEGRSEAFIRGFIREYDKTFHLYVSDKCSS
jgi:hypothetical protein